MVNNINGLTSSQNSASRSREKPQAPDPGTAVRKETTAPEGEQVELSSEAKKLQDVEKSLSRLPEVDHERVSHIKDALRDGSYSVDPARLAAKIAQFELNL